MRTGTLRGPDPLAPVQTGGGVVERTGGTWLECRKPRARVGASPQSFASAQTTAERRIGHYGPPTRTR
jgi:hypothetical protein